MFCYNRNRDIKKFMYTIKHRKIRILLKRFKYVFPIEKFLESMYFMKVHRLLGDFMILKIIDRLLIILYFIRNEIFQYMQEDF